ncbi:hypothetical protein [Parerythrobacter lacustris]|uniref:Helix-turn-helix domain-containing protein n=1 Tax=Parerythrobacter lacustris TaxID=2969984 RepID=A0ABT1XMT5_9SPHN|nr:hypothetical protein [Parerythrobacter lacustris]MCR2832975.1 hypothetical protein [Parerythrobacter lacustris]
MKNQKPTHSPLAAYYAARNPSLQQAAPQSALMSAAPPVEAEAVDPPEPVPLCKSPHWTGAKMAGFIDALAGSHSVAEAARSVGMSRQSAYRLRARLRDTTFDHAWEAAYQHGFNQLAQSVLERAINGVEVPHYYQGELIGTSRRYNDSLALALLRNRDMGGRSAYGRHRDELNQWQWEWDALLGRIDEVGPEGYLGDTDRWADDDCIEDDGRDERADEVPAPSVTL